MNNKGIKGDIVVVVVDDDNFSLRPEMPLGIVPECMCLLLLQHDIIAHVHNCIKGFSPQ